MTLQENKFDDNVAGVGGAVFSYDIGVKPTSGLTFNKNHYNRNSANLLGAVAILVSRSPNGNVTMSKEHFNFNWAATSVGALGMQGVSGRIDKLYFNHNDAGSDVDSLSIEVSPNLDIGNIQVAGEDGDDCLIEGNPACP